MPKVQTLKTKYPVFSYESHHWAVKNKDLFIRFHFKIEPDIAFRPTLKILNVNKKRIIKIGKKVLDNLVFHLGMIEFFSYWKATCSPQIIIKAGALSPEQIKWWKKVLRKGMAQFFYENQIKISKNLVQIKAAKMPPQSSFDGVLTPKNVLVALGGGKDSLVTLEILKKTHLNLYAFILNPGPISNKILDKAKLKKVIAVHRTIDPVLLSLNQKGFLNGHTPFSAYLAFLSALCGVIFDIKYLIFSNEKSAQEHNIVYQGEKVNHQWSKTLEFENMFRQYSKKFLARHLEYCSLVRKLSELQIARIFSGMKKYHSVFVSCNQPYKIGGRMPKWCGQCAKCLSTYILFSPFLSQKELKRIFEQELFKKIKLKKMLWQLLNEKGVKPFECVGTFKELRTALYLTCRKYENEQKNLPPLLTYFKSHIMPHYPALTKNQTYTRNLC